MIKKDVLLTAPDFFVWRRIKKLLSITAVMLFISAAAPLMTERAGCSHAGMSIAVRNVMVPMSDGIRLATDIYFPLPLVKSPVILIRTVYGKASGMSATAMRPGCSAGRVILLSFRTCAAAAGPGEVFTRFYMTAPTAWLPLPGFVKKMV